MSFKALTTADIPAETYIDLIIKMGKTFKLFLIFKINEKTLLDEERNEYNDHDSGISRMFK